MKYILCLNLFFVLLIPFKSEGQEDLEFDKTPISIALESVNSPLFSPNLMDANFVVDPLQQFISDNANACQPDSAGQALKSFDEKCIELRERCNIYMMSTSYKFSEQGLRSYINSKSLTNKKKGVFDICNDPSVHASSKVSSPCSSGSEYSIVSCNELTVRCAIGINLSADEKRICEEEAKQSELRQAENESKGKVSCCVGGICELSDEVNNCEMIDNSLLNTKVEGGENQDLFGLLANISNTGTSHPGAVKKMDSTRDCEKCWRAAYKTIPNKKSNRYLDRKKLLEKIKVPVDSLAYDFREKLQYFYQYESLVKDGLENSLGGSDYSSKLECIDDEVIQELKSKKHCSISKSDEKNLINKFNISEEKRKKIFESYLKESIGQMNLSIKEGRDKGEILNTAKAFFKNGILSKLGSSGIKENREYCSQLSTGKKSFNQTEFLNKITGFDGNIENALMIKLGLMLGPQYSFVSYDYKKYCSLLESSAVRGDLASAEAFFRDLGNIPNKKSSNEELNKVKDELAQMKLDLCPSQREIEESLCVGTENSIDSDGFKVKVKVGQLENLSMPEQMIANEYLCKGKFELVADEISVDEKVKGVNQQNIGSILAKGKKEAQNFEKKMAKIRSNNFAIDGNAIMERASLGDEDLLQTDLSSSEFETNEYDKSTPRFAINNQQEFNQAQDFSDLQSRVDQMSSVSLKDNEIAEAISNDRSLESMRAEIAAQIRASEASSVNAIENPEQAIFDYMKDKESESTKALADSELRAELEQLKSKINEKTLASREIQKDTSQKELEAARVRIKNLESMVSQMQSGNVGVSSSAISNTDSSQGNSSEQAISMIPQVGSSENSFGGERSIASNQPLLINTIPQSVQANMENYAKSGIVFKNDKLVLVVDETSYPLDIQEVIMKDGVPSGIRIQKSNKESITLSMGDMQEASKLAVQDYIKRKGVALLQVEKKSEEIIANEYAVASESYIQFLCSIHPDKSECKK